MNLLLKFHFFLLVQFYLINSQLYTYAGDNTYGQALQGTTGGSYSVMTTISTLSGLNVTSMSSGWYHTLYILSNNTYSFGDNSNGQCGDGTTTSRGTAYQLPHTTVQVSGGGISSMYLTTTGDVYSFGSGQYGTLCLGSTLDYYTPQKVSISNIIQIQMGGYSVTMLDSNGHVFTCGKNYRGQIGNGNFVDQYSPVSVTRILAYNITQIATGSQQVYALTSTGQVFIWGCNDVRFFY